METFREPRGHKGHLSITDPNYSTARKKKKRLDKLSTPEVNKSQSIIIVYLCTLVNVARKRSFRDRR